MIPIGKPKIDSFRLIIPLSKVDLNPNHRELNRVLTTINSDGEIIAEKENLSFRNQDDPASVKYILTKYDVYLKESAIKLGISAKSLGQSYFQGISKDTIEIIYQKLKSEDVVRVTRSELLEARIVDVDFCIDYFLEKGDIKTLINRIRKLTRPTTKANLGSNVFSEQTNKGIEFGKRDKVGKGYKTRQFLKYYAKALELKYNSTEFYEKYLMPQLNQMRILEDGSTVVGNRYFDEDRLIRIETTIKNSAHFKTYGQNIGTLKDVLSIKPQDMSPYFNRAIRMHMESRRFIDPDKKQMKPTDRALMIALKLRAQNLRMKPFDVVPWLAEELLGNEPSKQEMYRMKKKLYDLYDQFERGESLSLDENQKTIFEAIQEAENLGLIPG